MSSGPTFDLYSLTWDPTLRYLLSIACLYTALQLHVTDLHDERSFQDPEEEGYEDVDKELRAVDDIMFQRKEAAETWLLAVCKGLQINPRNLPPDITLKDLRKAALESHLTEGQHHEFAHDLVIISLTSSVSSSSSKLSKAFDSSAFIYSSHFRSLVRCTLDALQIHRFNLERAEQQVSQNLYFSLEEAKEKEEIEKENGGKSGWMKSVKEAKARAESQSKFLKWGMTGAGFIVGGVALGLTGGLAAPAVIPILSGLGISIFAGASGVLGIGFLFGLAGGGLAAYRTEKRFKAIEEFEFEKIGESQEKDEGFPNIPALDITICCAGFLLKKDEYLTTFESKFKSPHIDAYVLKCETEAYLETGQTLDRYVRNYLIKVGAMELVRRTALAAVLGAVALPVTIYKTAKLTLDNGFQQTRDKAAKAGVLLADVLQKRVQGGRPVKLIGSSLGAITVFNCLLELRRLGLHDLVYDVVLISSPLSPTYTEWEKVRSVVTHNVYNVFSDEDYVLAIVGRLHSLISTKMTYKVAGLQPVDAKGIINVDVSDILGGHLELKEKMPHILDRVSDVDLGKVVQLKKKTMEEREQELKDAEEKNGVLMDPIITT